MKYQIRLKDLLYFKKGGKVFLCGNGGSAADAQHLSAEFLVRLRPKLIESHCQLLV